MVEAIARALLTKGERRVSAVQTISSGANWVQIEVDRNSWLDAGSEVVKVAVEINEDGRWREIGRFGANGGVKLSRIGVPVTMSVARFSLRVKAGAAARVVIETKEALDTAVRLTWGQ